jgi:hypothetical protein
MAWESQRGKWDWQKYLTADEAAVIKEAHAARKKIQDAQNAYNKVFGRDVMMITNRAIQRAKYDAGNGH